MPDAPRTSDLSIRVRRFPSIVAIAMEVAPLVRCGLISDAEGRMLVNLRYAIRSAELADA